ncbi:MAG: DoxX family protein [Chloroflexi bacterium]|nr:MAG: DoxX family protein [Chloroflexota bacterium]
MAALNTTRTLTLGTITRRPLKTYARWTTQGLLAALFVFAGSAKFTMPPEMLTAGTPFSASFIYAIGAFEVLGALGLLASIAGRRVGQLARPAAAGLVVIMIGATVTTLLTAGGLGALFPATVGLLLTWLATTRR